MVEYESIALGLIPGMMEDKWFIYLEAGRLYVCRSWTGICIYEVEFEETANSSFRISHAWVNRDPVQYKKGDDNHDAQMLLFLIDRLLLDLPVPFPAPRNLSFDQAVYAHNIVGYGRSRNQIEAEDKGEDE